MAPASPSTASPSAPKKLGLVGGLLYTLLVLVALCIALYGAWIATSLAVYNDGPVWLAVVGALTCFFLIPLAWELVADRQQKGGRIRDAILRSSFLAIVFLVVLLATHPATAFKALATRGDWFLGGSTSESSQSVRGFLGKLAGGLEGLYNLTRKEVFEDDAEAKSISPTPQPTVVPDASKPGTVDVAKPPPTKVVPPASGLPIPGSAWTWPLPKTVHPVLAKIPEESKASIAALGKYLAAELQDPFERTKAVHDFVATWVSYDVALLRQLDAGIDVPDITAAAVFKTRKSVCDGYSKLLVALGKASGLKIVRVTGDTRSISDYAGLKSANSDPVLGGAGHAWNAVEIEKRWYLLDPTWDAGHVRDDTYVPEYTTTYLFTPPEVMALNHLPEANKWQLSELPISRATWLRMPLLRPDFIAEGLALRDPTAPAINAGDKVSVTIDNPRGLPLALSLTGPDGKRTPLCATTSDPAATLACALPAGGRYTADISVMTDPAERLYWGMGSILVDASP